MQDEKSWEQLAARLGLPELATDLLRQALSHPSYVREAGQAPYLSNQRLEFLGDTVLDAITAGELYQRFPEMPEGWLTRAKAAIVRTANLANVARRLNLGEYLLLGHGEENSSGRTKTSLLADALEAVIGAIYLSVGWAPVGKFVLDHFQEAFRDAEDRSLPDPKTALQEVLQARTQKTPEYVTVRCSGPAHAPVFEIEVCFADQVLGRGRGRNKQEAEQAAARDALAARDQWIAKLAPD